MEEDSGVKAPVTRLRRRLSVEQSDDVKSPGPATPTKKRGGRLAAKPQLDLIEENAPTPGSATKRATRKTSVKEIVEAEEKPVTPSRRSTRIKSNTSIVSETTQAVDSPRAKRAAARRTSQVGSDSESSVTPARATRRTRKDSASSVEKLEVTLASKPSNITEVIIEETESSSIKSDDNSKSNENNTEITPTRRSPRLKGKKQDEKKTRTSTHKNSLEPEQLNSSTNSKLNDSKQNLKNDSIVETPEEVESQSAVSPVKPKENNSDSSLLIIQELDKKPRKQSSTLNKSTSALADKSFKNKRQRTQSWTVTLHTQADEGIFYSDNESVKKKINKSQAFKGSKNDLEDMGSGDHVLNTSRKEKSILQTKNDTSVHNRSIEENTPSDSSFATMKARISKGAVTPNKSSNTLDVETISPQGNKENIGATEQEDINNEIKDSTKFFEKAPTTILQSTIIYDDSDTDSKTKGKKSQLDTEDQRVPEVNNQLINIEEQSRETPEIDKVSHDKSLMNKSKDKVTDNADDDGCEPMDIDETIPNNISVTEFSLNKSNSDIKTQNVKDQPVAHLPLIDSSLNKSSNQSRRKSSLTNIDLQNLEKTENKSTLILSQIKDISSTEHNSSKSPKSSNEVMSKSVCSVSLIKDKVIDKKNLSQDYSTSTPLQQKKFQKLGMQINSSIIDTSNIESKKDQNKAKTEVSQISRSSGTTSENDSEDEVDSSRPRNSLLDDEAEVASDDYESGDSQDEDDRQYEIDNEIIEKGETLDSDDEMSNDTDYEKDSFVVSSDEEDNDLLSGSGDDLSMSDNELTMSKKSKDKFNERKLKVQKKASREMYEARHKLDASDASVKSKKSKRQKIESSEESTDEEIIAPVKRNKLRLDSTQDESLNKSNVNDSKRKSKRKRLSESICDENANTELEVTVYGEHLSQATNDPLSVQVKLEPKTPMKSLDISTVQINENIEEVCVDNNNVSVMKSNETVDPLQATMLQEDSSSMSENSEIMNNYDSVLKNLNKDNKSKKVKSLDMSLNLNKKKKQDKQPIIDQLNITNTKKSKKTKMPIGRDVVDSAQSNESPSEKINAFEESSSSDSIDLQLLFSEDSNEASQESLKSKEISQDSEPEEVQDFIPLKRTPGKTNILNSTDNTESHSLNESIKLKNKKRESKEPTEEPIENSTTVSNDIQIIIDTHGTHDTADKSVNVSLSASAKKKKNRKSNLTMNDDADFSMFNLTAYKKEEDVSDNVPYESTKSKKQNRKSSETHIEETPQEESTRVVDDSEGAIIKKKNRKSSQTHLDEEPPKAAAASSDDEGPVEVSFESSKSKKKTRKSSEKQHEDEISNEVVEDAVNISMNANSAKKKKKKTSESQNEQNIDDNNVVPEVDINISMGSAKKSKKKNANHSQVSIGDGDSFIPDFDMNKSIGSAKKPKNKKANTSQVTIEDDASAIHDIEINKSIGSAKKSKNKKANTSQVTIEDEINVTPAADMNKSVGSSKKPNNKNGNNSLLSIADVGDEIETNVTTKAESAKKKKKLSISYEKEEPEARNELIQNISVESTKKKKTEVINDATPFKDVNFHNVEKSSENSKKRKRKSSGNLEMDSNFEGRNSLTQDNSILIESQKKKRKISQSDDSQKLDGDAATNVTESQKKKSKSVINSGHNEINQVSEPKKKNKKRKERDDDDENKVTKIFKENSFDKVNVSRLPTSILSQLDDKPNKEVLEIKKSSVVSTTPFHVEDTRKHRSKPSKFLEESVYLNDSYVEKKQKTNIKKPKVLPFIPTAVTSGSGFTTNFKINIIPQEVQFVAQTKTVANFKNDYLYSKKIKRLGTYETYKKHRSAKMSKF